VAQRKVACVLTGSTNASGPTFKLEELAVLDSVPGIDKIIEDQLKEIVGQPNGEQP
jgi:hypothetical protein